MTRGQTERNIFNRFALMEARPEMWASTREAFGLQIVAFVELLLWPNGDLPRDEQTELMKQLFGPGPVISADPIDAAWAREAIAAARRFVEEKRSKPSSKTVTRVHHATTGQGHAAYRDLIAALGGPCRPEIVGWFDVDVDGTTRPALVVTQAWPFLPHGTDPAPIIKAKKHVALIPEEEGFRFVEVPPPPLTKVSP